MLRAPGRLAGGLETGHQGDSQDMFRTVHLLAAAVLCGGLLAGCAAPVMEAASITKDQVIYDQNIEQARAGNAEAQYKVGEAQCCNLVDAGEKAGLYNTVEAVRWLCKSAAQGYGPAAYKVGKVYAGDVVDGVRLMRRAAAGIIGTVENPPVAYAWLRQAELKGVDGAKDRASDLWKDMTPAQWQEATKLVQSKAPLPCDWDKVIGAKAPVDS